VVRRQATGSEMLRNAMMMSEAHPDGQPDRDRADEEE
jgi:hypothetical protein